jgi:hypothetical protein
MTLSEKQQLFSRNFALLVLWASSQPGWAVRIGEVQRSVEQQALYVEEGLSQTMDSLHLDKLAGDLALFIDGEYQEDSEAYRPLGDVWCALDPENVWGGNWPSFVDGNHFEYAG